MDCWNCGKFSHIKKNCREKKNDEKKNDIVNVVIEEIQDALLLCVDITIDSWVFNLRAFFHTTAHHEVLENYCWKL